MQESSGLPLSELDRIEARYNAATAGPWYSWVAGRNLDAGLSCIELGSGKLAEVIGMSVEDQDFVASAREDLPKLLAEVRRLRACIAKDAPGPSQDDAT